MSPAEAFFVASVATKFYKTAELKTHALPFRPKVTLYCSDWPVDIRTKIREGFQDAVQTDAVGRTKLSRTGTPLYLQENRPDVLVASVGQIGVAIELQRADTMINIGPYPTALYRIQTPGRIARVGSAFEKVRIYTLRVNGFERHQVGESKEAQRRYFERFMTGASDCIVLDG